MPAGDTQRAWFPKSPDDKQFRGGSEGSQGFGLGFWVTEKLGRTGLPGSVGAFGWGGAYYTIYWVDPVEKLVAVFMTQLLPAGAIDLQDKFKVMVYHSIVDSYER